jgi:hypothetical protein
VLNSVATFVRGNTQRRRGSSVVVRGRKHEALVGRVVMVTEELVVLDYRDIIDTLHKLS